MKCPFCGYEESKVIDSRPTDEGQRIRRRRECLQCTKRFTTYEIIESLPIIVIKKDKSRETFNRDKLMTGLLRACEKRPVSIDTLDNMIDEIEVISYYEDSDNSSFDDSNDDSDNLYIDDDDDYEDY